MMVPLSLPLPVLPPPPASLVEVLPLDAVVNGATDADDAVVAVAAPFPLSGVPVPVLRCILWSLVGAARLRLPFDLAIWHNLHAPRCRRRVLTARAPLLQLFHGSAPFCFLCWPIFRIPRLLGPVFRYSFLRFSPFWPTHTARRWAHWRLGVTLLAMYR